MSANGRLTDAELSNADGGMQLANVTARAWENMAAACETETGLSLSIVRPAGAYRSYFVQGDMKQNPGRWNLNPASSVSLAGPGYSSHGFGRAVDISSFTGRRRSWVLANAGRFGFSRTFGEADPNHFGHDGATTGPNLNTSSSVKPQIAEPEPELKVDEDMQVLIGVTRPDKGTDFHLLDIGPRTRWNVPNMDQVNFYRNLGIVFHDKQSSKLLDGYRAI